MINRRIIGPIFFALLTACSGGGSNGSSSGGNPPVSPTGNTSLPYYLPMAQGNTWTFTNGAKIVDMGPVSAAACVCAAASMERMALYDPGSSAINGSFFFTKNVPAGGTQLTNILGVENDTGTANITFFPVSTYVYGVPVMDDSPSKNETWNDGLGDVSTITSTGGTLALSNSSTVNNVAIDQQSNTATTITWGFAKGVGFTELGTGGTSIEISSFSVSTQNSTSVTRHPEAIPIAKGHFGHPDVDGLMRGLVVNAAVTH